MKDKATGRDRDGRETNTTLLANQRNREFSITFGQFSERNGHRMNVTGTWFRKVDTVAVREQESLIV